MKTASGWDPMRHKTIMVCLDCGKRLSTKYQGRTTKRHFQTAHAGFMYEHGYAQVLRPGELPARGTVAWNDTHSRAEVIAGFTKAIDGLTK